MVELNVHCVVLSVRVLAHVLWECSSYSTCRDNFQEALKQLLGARYPEFERRYRADTMCSLQYYNTVEKTSYLHCRENVVSTR